MNMQTMTLTDAAANRVRELMEKREQPALGLRVGIRTGGCRRGGSSAGAGSGDRGAIGSNGSTHSARSGSRQGRLSSGSRDSVWKLSGK